MLISSIFGDAPLLAPLSPPSAPAPYSSRPPILSLLPARSGFHASQGPLRLFLPAPPPPPTPHPRVPPRLAGERPLAARGGSMSVKGLGRALSLAELKVIVAESETRRGLVEPPVDDSTPLAPIVRRSRKPAGWSQQYVAFCACVALLIGCSPMILLATSMLILSDSATAREGRLADGPCNDDNFAQLGTAANATPPPRGHAMAKRCRGKRGARVEMAAGRGKSHDSSAARVQHRARTQSADDPSVWVNETRTNSAGSTNVQELTPSH